MNYLSTKRFNTVFTDSSLVADSFYWASILNQQHFLVFFSAVAAALLSLSNLLRPDVSFENFPGFLLAF